MTLSLISPAKINLSLDVGHPRPDGYHDIRTVFCRIDLADELDLTPGDEPGIRLIVEEGDAPDGDANLAVRAAEMIRRECGTREGLEIRLRKRIPLQSGLGGGSSNAAAALRGAAELFGYAGELSALAAQLGSDVPFFLNGRIALGEGKGERLRGIPSCLPLHFLIVRPDIGVSTAWAYAELDRSGACGTTDYADRTVRALQSDDRDALLASLGNSFEPVVFSRHPEIARLKQRLLEAGAEAALLCGSGSAVFGIFPTRDAAEGAASGFGDVWNAVSSSTPEEVPA